MQTVKDLSKFSKGDLVGFLETSLIDIRIWSVSGRWHLQSTEVCRKEILVEVYQYEGVRQQWGLW